MALDPNDPHIPDEDKIPEAPIPSPKRELYMKVVENHAAQDYPGGTVGFGLIRPLHPDLVDARLVLSAFKDETLHEYPWKYVSSKQNRYYKVIIEEIDVSELPPEPQPERVPTPAELAPPPEMIIRPKVQP